MDRLDYFHGVGADGVFRVIYAAGSRDADAPLCHLLNQFLNACGQVGAVGDDYNADHVFLFLLSILARVRVSRQPRRNGDNRKPRG